MNAKRALRTGLSFALASAVVFAPQASAVEYTVTTIGGGGATACTTTPTVGTSVNFSNIWGMGSDSAGNIYFANRNGRILCKMDTNGTVVRIAGTGGQGAGADNVQATTSALGGPMSVVVDASGNIIFTEYDLNYSIRKIAPNGNITTILNVAHSGSVSGTGGAATSAGSTGPAALAISPSGEIYFSDYGACLIRKIDLSGNVQLVAGTTCGTGGDGGIATSGQISQPSGLAFDSSGNLYIASYTGYIKKVDTSGIMTRFAGSYSTLSHTGDGGQASSATLKYIWQIAIDGGDNLWIPERGGSTIRKINIPTGIISTVAGLDGTTGNTDGLSSAARFNAPYSIAIGLNGDLFIGDYGNALIRKIAGAAAAASSPITLTFSATSKFRTSAGIQASGGSAGKITFYANGKRIPRCISVAFTSSYTCAWSPSTRGAVRITATIITAGNSVISSPVLVVNTGQRSTTR